MTEGIQWVKIKLDGGEDMKHVYRLGGLISAGGLYLSIFANKAFAAVSVCPPGAKNPQLCSLTLTGALPNVINILLFVAFLAALIFLIYGGIRWILSGGDKEGTGKAKGTVTAALIGLAIVLASWLLINIVLSFFGLNNQFNFLNIFGGAAT